MFTIRAAILCRRERVRFRSGIILMKDSSRKHRSTRRRFTMSLGGQVAIVTGASRGIGRAIALELARQGARVLVNYQRNAAAADEVVAAIDAAGGTALPFAADVTDEDAVAAMVAACVERWGRLDMLVNNAGI